MLQEFFVTARNGGDAPVFAVRLPNLTRFKSAQKVLNELSDSEGSAHKVGSREGFLCKAGRLVTHYTAVYLLTNGFNLKRPS